MPSATWGPGGKVQAISGDPVRPSVLWAAARLVGKDEGMGFMRSAPGRSRSCLSCIVRSHFRRPGAHRRPAAPPRCGY